MKFTLSWLKEYLDTPASLPEICHKLNNIGLEVESVTDSAKNLAPFFVAQIVKALPHPESQKLQICQVDVGTKELLQVVCGAKNARDGLKVAFAPIDSIIPANGMKIKKSKIAGIESHGMLCSAVELGLGKDSEGIIEIEQKFPIGTKISEVFGLNEAVIEINATPNRGDCLGVYGIARDLSASGIGTLKSPTIKPVKGDFPSPITVQISSQNCNYFAGCYIKNVKNVQPPKWLQDRLSAVGINSISTIVDITNYVMLCLNQPMHAYDADKLQGIMVVDEVKNYPPLEGGSNSLTNSESSHFKSLNNIEYKLNNGDLIITNNHKIISLAGIIGSQNGMVDKTTQNIFLEAAYFNPENIAKTGRKLNILSDARYRFERGIDISGTKSALEMAINLILEICGGNPSNITEASLQGKTISIQKTRIEFDLNKIQPILGIVIEKHFITTTLENLGFKITNSSENILNVEVPTHRSDIKIAQDLVEEIIRTYGLDKINSIPLISQNITNQPSALEIIRNQLANSGLIEAINWSFIDQKLAEIFSPLKPELAIINPIAQQMNYMRPNLVIGLLQLAAKNQARGFDDLAVFEIGKVFLGEAENQQKNMVCAIKIGKNKIANHYKNQRNFDVFDVKKDLLDCLSELGFSTSSFQMENNALKHYHPHRSATLKLGKNTVAYFGELHPAIVKKFDIKGRVNIFELAIDDLPLNLNKKPTKKPFIISDFQTVNRDFAFVVDAEVPAGEILKKASEVDKTLITEVNLFDIYQDQKLGTNKKSIAFSIQISPAEKTLTSEEIEVLSQKIIKKITTDCGGILRG